MTTTSNESSPGPIWELVQTCDGQQPDVIALGSAHRTLGRTDDANIILNSLVVSKVHARVGLTETLRPFVEDLKSTNGTFVNRQKIEQRTELNAGDSVRFANLEYVVKAIPVGAPVAPTPAALPETQGTQPTTSLSNNSTLANDTSSEMPAASASANAEVAGSSAGGVSWTSAVMQFEELMDPSGDEPNYRPIVCLTSGDVVGFECVPGTPTESVVDVSETAVEESTELSNLMRRASINAVNDSVEDPEIVFLNTHPTEGYGFRLETSLKELRRSAPNLQVAIVLKEEVVKDSEGMEKLRTLMKELDIKLACDEFGADQERLGQLVESPPAFLKFDVNMIRNVSQSTERHRTLVGSLVKAVRGMGITTVAEGVESKEEAQACIELGFQYAQGAFFGKPRPISKLHEPDAVCNA